MPDSERPSSEPQVKAEVSPTTLNGHSRKSSRTQLDSPNSSVADFTDVALDRAEAPKRNPSQATITTRPEDPAIPADKDIEALKITQDYATDPSNPRNWSHSKKWTATMIVSLYTLVSPLASSMMAPGLPDVARQYAITNETIVALTLSIFLLSFALGPLIWAPLSEIWGRAWLLHVANIGVIAFSFGCAFSPNVTTLIVMRFFMGLFAASPIAIGGGCIGDLFSERDRASAMAIYSLGPLLGPAFGPVIGGFTTQALGIKYVFIIIGAFSGLVSVVGVALLRETYAPVLQLNKAKKEGILEEFLESHPELAYLRGSTAHLIWINISRPTILLFRSFICFILCLYMAYLYGLYYLMFTTFSDLFGTVYGFGPGIGGLVYLGLGVGFILATIVGARFANQVYLHLGKKNGGVNKPEHRLPALIFGSFFVPVSLLWYGWSADQKIHWIMPIIGSGIFGFALMVIYLPIQLYLVDTYSFAASATAAAAVFRSLFGFAFPLFANQMFDALGIGPGNSLLAGISIVLGIPFPIWIYYKGEQMRAKDKYAK